MNGRACRHKAKAGMADDTGETLLDPGDAAGQDPHRLAKGSHRWAMRRCMESGTAPAGERIAAAVIVSSDVLDAQRRFLEVLAVELGDEGPVPGGVRQVANGRWEDPFGEVIVERVSSRNGPDGYRWRWWPQGDDGPREEGVADFALPAIELALGRAQRLRGGDSEVP
jgi:hypothetical protein